MPPHLLRLADAGDAKPAWITLLTTEHYALGMQRAATISEVNGRASIFIGAVSAGLIALGFEGAGSRHSAGSTVLAALVLTPLLFLGLVTFGRCLQIAIDDWEFSVRIMRLRAAYAQLVPELAGLLAGAAAGTVLIFATARYQWARWCEASSAPARASAPPGSLRAR